MTATGASDPGPGSGSDSALALALEADTGRGPDSEPVPDTGPDWAATVGLYVAAVATATVASAAIAAGASSDVVLGLAPSVFTGSLLCGAIVARANPRLALRVGTLRWRTVALCLPALLVAGAVGLLAATGAVAGTWALALAGGAIVGIGLPARLVALVARDVTVDAAIDGVAGERPAAEWTWYQSGTNVGMIGFGAALLGLDAVLYLALGRASARLFLGGVVCVAIGWSPTVSLPNPVGGDRIRLSMPDVEHARAEIRAYRDGFVVEPRFVPSYRRFIPWDDIAGVRLTDERLVLERRWRPDVRCDRAAIDDLEGVLETLEDAGASVRRNGRGTTD